MTTSTNEPTVLPQPEPLPDFEPPYIEQRLRLASDNPSPETASGDAEPVSALIQMATYRLSAVFGELRWVDGEVA